jgi:light-harvesting complex II chlorophyll a/b binding protein 5
MNGTLAGDYGFDPLQLGKDGKIAQYRIAEVQHARWAMLAVPGVVIPEALGVPGGNWTETGKVFLDGEAGRPEILGNPYLFTAIEVALLAGVEGYRSGKLEAPAGFAPIYGKFEGKDFKGLDQINPGGPLDFLNVASTPEDLAILKVKEIKNGRLAMIAMLGVFVQGATTGGEGPATNWAKHVADPFAYNFVTISAIDRTPVL